MKVLVTGATGLIGGHVLRALRVAGHSVVGMSRRRPQGEAEQQWIECDFADMRKEQAWLPLLDGVDAVVNCVGIIRETLPGDFDRLHRAAPIALFAACERAAVRRVVQVSALGSHPDAATGYWRSKGAAEHDLLARTLSSVIIRPSLVYGDAGASSIMFRMLATLPVLAMPMAHGAKVQGIHVEELAEIVASLVSTEGAVPRELAVVGPRATTMADYLAALREGMGAPGAVVLDLPMPVARLVARVAQLMPSSALTPESLLMLERSADGSNTADARPAAALLGRPLRDPLSFARPDLLPAAVMDWGRPLLTIVMAMLWLLTAAVSWFGWPHAESFAWLAACGIPPAWQEPVLLGASVADCVMGLALLLRPRRWLWLMQLTLVLGYTVAMTFCLPEFWLHPFGPLSKNLPVLALMALMWRVTPKPIQSIH
ncbi:SDR family oxidoreductase [Oxalobacteraceae bacterium]|nr:SDR family oxidoreductase [Oxalobacteraceae bacterium]